MKTLGHWVSNDGSFQRCLTETCAAMLRAFWGNMSTGLFRASEHTKLKFMKTCILTIASSRWARWTYRAGAAETLDSLQRKLVAILCNIRPDVDEPFDAYCERRKRKATKIARRHGLWSHLWANSIVSWHDHVMRGHDEKVWSRDLLEWRGPMWLQLQREIWSYYGQSRTNSRVGRGAPPRRWLQGVAAAREIS